MFKKILNQFLEIFFPSHCLSCPKIISKDSLFCAKCWVKLNFITDSKCKICSYPFEVEIKNAAPFCASCLVKRPSFEKVITIFRYNYVIKKIISNLKYKDQGYLAKKFGKILADRIKKENIEFDLIVAVPLHLERLKKRKFNQAVFLAKALKKYFPDSKFYPDLLFRVKNTPSQTKLTKKQRIKNMKRAFMVNKKYRDYVKDKNILLIDDIMTSGATLENCTKELKRRKAKSITVATIAKTVF